MKSTSAVRDAIVYASTCLILLISGCGTPQTQQAAANRPRALVQQPTSLDATHLSTLLTKISQLQSASQESLDAAKLIGTPEDQLTEAQQAYMLGEQKLKDGAAAYRAEQYAPSWSALEAAGAAFWRAEEAAVRAGLVQLERELVANYGRLLSPDARASPYIAGHQ
jgi:murein L,D-transpeptidase YcbB/YkuD